MPMSIGKSATINEPANVRPDKTATVSLLPVALLPVHHNKPGNIELRKVKRLRKKARQPLHASPKRP